MLRCCPSCMLRSDSVQGTACSLLLCPVSAGLLPLPAASCDTYTRAFECAEGVLGQALTEPSLERSDWREVLTEFNFMK